MPAMNRSAFDLDVSYIVQGDKLLINALMNEHYPLPVDSESYTNLEIFLNKLLLKV